MPARRRAWCWAGCAGLVVLVYLTVWTVYSSAHLSAFPRYDQLDSGVAARQFGADFRLLSLVQTEELAAETGDPQVAGAGAVWIVATVEVTQRELDPDFVCSLSLLGPDDRSWERATIEVSRPATKFCSEDDLELGRPFRLEQIYEVPVRYADQIRGVAVEQRRDTSPLPVLTPPG